MKIAVMMSIGCQNLGDELILKNEIKLLREKYGNNTIFKVFTYDVNNIFYTDKNIEYLEYFPIGIKNPKNLLRNIKNYYHFIKTIKWADKVVIGGGGIFFDNEKGNYSNPLNQWLFRTQIIKILKKEIIIFGVSIDINKQKSYKQISSIFKKADEIYVRDKNSFGLLKKLNIDSIIIKDPVFYDNGKIGLDNYKKDFCIKKIKALDFKLDDIKNINFENKKVGIAFRRGYLSDNLIKKIVDFILNSGGEIILLPHSFHTGDEVANDYEFLKEFVGEKIKITRNMQETYGIYQKSLIDICLSMRLHSMILSQVYGIEFIAIKYAKKGDLM